MLKFTYKLLHAAVSFVVAVYYICKMYSGMHYNVADIIRSCEKIEQKIKIAIEKIAIKLSKLF